MSFLKNVWKDPVGSKLIAAGLTAVAAAGLSTWLKWWPAIGRGLASAGQWFLASSPIPNWFSLLGALALFAVLLVIVIGIVAATRSVPPSSSSPSPSHYRADRFFGVDWTWRWPSGSYNEIYNACPLCPNCKYQLTVERSYDLNGIGTAFRCDSCRDVVSKVEGDPNDLEQRLIRVIHQKLRNNTWRDVVNQQGGGQ